MDTYRAGFRDDRSPSGFQRPPHPKGIYSQPQPPAIRRSARTTVTTCECGAPVVQGLTTSGKVIRLDCQVANRRWEFRQTTDDYWARSGARWGRPLHRCPGR